MPADETEAVAPLSPPGSADGEPASRAVAPEGENGAPLFDETAESAYLADARERGEAVSEPATVAVIEAEESSGQPLPKLAELIDRIPPEVRETLDDLFRARFVTVKRFPKKALKGG